jgi:ankyrin repeat protein
MCATKEGHVEIVAALLKREETNVNHVNHHQLTALLIASNMGHLQMQTPLASLHSSLPLHVDTLKLLWRC